MPYGIAATNIMLAVTDYAQALGWDGVMRDQWRALHYWRSQRDIARAADDQYAASECEGMARLSACFIRWAAGWRKAQKIKHKDFRS